ncbi:ion transporter [Persicimonas caeni]|uniref:Ion transporter n=1 Tax=Persicimonas caeni TaxID=2292766 RepID=A0A4Y6PVP3_PERCE|nr:ion transporter [Persicimonas caeni]QDG52424.1 ion transporter [Persicimonas caeni]QED33646.1 ion transporter [Persicimonas caeni]
MLVEKLQEIAEAKWFTNFITFVIILAGVVVGMETYPSVVEAYETELHILNEIILWIFVAEVVVKMGAEGSKPWNYFKDPWNVFDFFIVAVCFVPGAGSYAVILRLVRLLRVLKLLSALPRLQLLVGALLKSLPSMGYVTILLGLLFYVYAVAAVFIFGANDPMHFETLHLATLSLFRVVTLEDWTDVMYINMYGCDEYGYDGVEHLCTDPNAMPVVASAFFVSFVLLGTMVILNLFIGVIMNGMEEATMEQEEFDERERMKKQGITEPEHTVEHELFELDQALEELHKKVAVISRRVRAEHDGPPATDGAVDPAE